MTGRRKRYDAEYKFETALEAVKGSKTINDQLKNISQIAHTRHHSPTNFLFNLVVGLIAHANPGKKSSLRLTDQESASLPVPR